MSTQAGTAHRAAERSPVRFTAFLLAAAVVVLLAALGAGADHQVVLRSPLGGDRSAGAWQRPEAYSEEQWGNSEEEQHEPREDDGAYVSLIVSLLVVTAIPIGLVAVVVVRRLRRAGAGALPSPGALGRSRDLPLFTVEDAAESVRAAREHLRTADDPHGAVVAAWLELERAVAASGFRRGPSQTTQEYVTGILARVDLDREALARFAELYRRALFDARPLSSADAADALAQLDLLAAQLDAAQGGTTQRGTTQRGAAKGSAAQIDADQR